MLDEIEERYKTKSLVRRLVMTDAAQVYKDIHDLLEETKRLTKRIAELKLHIEMEG